MTVQYNIPIKVIDPIKEWMIQTRLQDYRILTDRSGNLESICFSKENLPYVGEMTIVKTLKKEAAKLAYMILSGIEGLLVHPINESIWEEDLKRVKELRDSVTEIR